jgi:protein-tyrosine phosphatase
MFFFNSGQRRGLGNTSATTGTSETRENSLKVPYIDHVVDGVYIGSLRATKVVNHLRRVNIKHVLKLYEDGPSFPRDFVVLDNAFPDGEFVPKPTLSRGVDFVLKQVYENKRVLVACAAGISRSSTFVLSFLLEMGYDLQSAYDLLFSKHPEADPHPRLWESLIVHHDLRYSLDDVKHF